MAMKLANSVFLLHPISAGCCSQNSVQQSYFHQFQLDKECSTCQLDTLSLKKRPVLKELNMRYC